MARTSVTTVRGSMAGTVLNPPAVVIDGDIIDTGDVLLIVTAGATPTTVSIPTTKTVNGLAVADAGGTVAANTERVFGPFPANLFAQATDAPVGAGRVLVDYTSVATVSRRVVAV